MESLATQKYVLHLLHGSRWASLLFVLLVMGCSSDPPH